MSEQIGEIVHGEVFVDGAGAASAIVLYQQGTSTVRTLAATEFLYITDLVMTSEAGGEVSIYFGSDAVGKRLLKMVVAAKSGYDHEYCTPVCGPKGVGLTVNTTGADWTFVAIEGFIRSA